MMGKPETAIEMASRHVADRDVLCRRQSDLIERLRHMGLDTTEAEHLLTLFQDCLALSRARLRRLTEIAEGDLP